MIIDTDILLSANKSASAQNVLFTVTIDDVKYRPGSARLLQDVVHLS